MNEDHDARERRRLELEDPERAEVTALERADPNHPAVTAWRERRLAEKRARRATDHTESALAAAEDRG